jgi:O-antigen/teichoic acid export membrane protein
MKSPAEANQTESPPADHYLAAESKTIAKGGVIVIIGTLVAQGLSMAVTLWIARVLGPDKYGLISLAMSILLPLSALASLGLRNSLVRFLPVHIGNNEEDRVAGVLSSAFVMAGISSLLLTAGIVVLSPIIANNIFSEPLLEPVLRVLALTIPLSVTINLATAATHGSKVMHYDAIVQIAGPIFRLLTWVVGLLLLKNLLDAAIYATLLQQLFPAILAVFFAYWIFRTYFGKGIRWAFKPLWVYSAPLILSTLMYNLAPRMDRLVLGVVSDSRAVGVYSAAASLAILLILVHSSVVKTFLPVIADSYNRISVERARDLFFSVTRWDARLTFIGVVSAILVAQEILGLLGNRYAEALLPFVILATSAYISTIPGPTGAFLQMTNRQGVEAANAIVFFIIGPLIQLGLAFWLGWIGVAVGVLVMTVIINVIQSAEIYHFYEFHVFQRDHLLFTVMSIGVVAFCAVAGIKLELPIRLALLGLVSGSFLAFIYLSRTANDIFMFKMITGGSPLEEGQEKSD